MAGVANTWTIDVGSALAQYADAYISAAFPKGSDAVIRIDLEKFDVHDFEAHCDVRFTMTREGSPALQKTYHGEGFGYAAQVVWGGPFAMKSSMRQTTDEALRSAFQQFLKDGEVLRLAQGGANGSRASEASVTERLKRLQELFSKGFITEQEYNRHRAKILGDL
jgi:Short C-terminal domain